jgi:hypothetical protein
MDLPTVLSASENLAENRSSRISWLLARTADALGHLEHVLCRLVDAHKELDLDVGADVVAADQAFVARAVNLDGLDRDVHQLGACE